MNDDEIIEKALNVLAARVASGPVLDSPEATKRFLQLRIADEPNEVFGVMFLDNRHRILKTENLFYGTIDGCSVHPRVVAKRALELNAAAVILFHNHPSGYPEPSHADRAMTKRMREALDLLDIRVLDHIVVGNSGVCSFAERGL